MGGAGGVGSIATQLARRLTRLIVIATASRPETYSWSREMGAHHVIDQRQPISEQVKAIAPEGETIARGFQRFTTISKGDGLRL